MTSTSQTVLITTVTTLSLLILRSFLRKRKLAALGPLPPGPKGVPVLGNALDLPKTQEWLTYAKWGKVRDRPQNTLSPLLLISLWHAGIRTHSPRRRYGPANHDRQLPEDCCRFIGQTQCDLL